jgi:pimeloyl-ACP methyl ester carboxylesterase
MFRDRIEEQLPEIRAHTLVIRGERDPTMPARWAQEATTLLPHGRLVTIRGHGHCVHYTNPAVVGNALLVHVGENPSPSV